MNSWIQLEDKATDAPQREPLANGADNYHDAIANSINPWLIPLHLAASFNVTLEDARGLATMLSWQLVDAIGGGVSFEGHMLLCSWPVSDYSINKCNNSRAKEQLLGMLVAL